MPLIGNGIGRFIVGAVSSGAAARYFFDDGEPGAEVLDFLTRSSTTRTGGARGLEALRKWDRQDRDSTKP